MSAIALSVAIRKNLMLPGETLQDCIREIKKLTAKDRQDLVRYFAAKGIEIIDQPQCIVDDALNGRR